MKNYSLVFLVFFLIAQTSLFAQDEGLPNRTTVEEGWFSFKSANKQDHPEQVKKLYLESLEIIPIKELQEFPNLESLIIKEIPLKDLSFLEMLPRLRVLELYSNGLKSLNGLEKCKGLREFGSMHNFISDISILSQFPEMTFLNLYDNELTDISVLRNLEKLKVLDVGRNPIKSVFPIIDLKSLTYLSIYKCTSLNSLAPIENFQSLEELNISLIGQKDFSLLMLSDMDNLVNIRVQGMVKNNDELQHIAHLTQLEGITMGINDGVTDISVLKDLKKLTYLDIHSNNITDISVVSNYPALAKLVMYRNKVNDISPLSKNYDLQALFLFENPIEDFSALYKLPFLEYLQLSRKDFDDEKEAALQKALPATRLTFY